MAFEQIAGRGEASVGGRGLKPPTPQIAGRGGASVGSRGAQAPYPQELHWRQRGRRRRIEGKGGGRRGRKRNDPLGAGAGSATDCRYLEDGATGGNNHRSIHHCGTNKWKREYARPS